MNDGNWKNIITCDKLTSWFPKWLPLQERQQQPVQQPPQHEPFASESFVPLACFSFEI
jgi:hypothetical protein